MNKSRIIRPFTLLFFAVAAIGAATAQVNVGSTSAPDSSAVLQATSTAKGFLPPRMTTAQRNSIAGPASGLTVFNTANNQLEYNAGTPSSPAWSPVGGSSATVIGGYTSVGNYNLAGLGTYTYPLDLGNTQTTLTGTVMQSSILPNLPNGGLIYLNPTANVSGTNTAFYLGLPSPSSYVGKTWYLTLYPNPTYTGSGALDFSYITTTSASAVNLVINIANATSRVSGNTTDATTTSSSPFTIPYMSGGLASQIGRLFAAGSAVYFSKIDFYPLIKFTALNSTTWFVEFLPGNNYILGYN